MVKQPVHIFKCTKTRSLRCVHMHKHKRLWFAHTDSHAIWYYMYSILDRTPYHYIVTSFFPLTSPLLSHWSSRRWTFPRSFIRSTVRSSIHKKRCVCAHSLHKRYTSIVKPAPTSPARGSRVSVDIQPCSSLLLMQSQFMCIHWSQTFRLLRCYHNVQLFHRFPKIFSNFDKNSLIPHGKASNEFCHVYSFSFFR